MDLIGILRHQGWTLYRRTEWLTVKDPRPEFRAAFGSDRVGKVIGTNFYITLPQIPEVEKGLIRQLGREPVSMKSTIVTQGATVWGFDTTGLSIEAVQTFVSRLAGVIDELI